MEYLQPYRRALGNEAQEAPAPFVPDFSDPKKPWLEAVWSTEKRSLSRNTPYAQNMERLIEAINEAPAWRTWWRSSGLQVLRVSGHLARGTYRQRISRGRTSAEAWSEYGHTHDAAPAHATDQLASDDLRTALAAVQEHLRLQSHPVIPA